MICDRYRPTRRVILLGSGAIGLASLAGCISVLPSSDTAGASRMAESRIAALRQQNGLSALSSNAKLEHAAIEQAGYMAIAGQMEHTALYGRDFFSRMKKNDIDAPAAENLAHGHMDIARVLEMWMESPPHRRNMLDERFGQFGLGYAVEPDGRRYWAMVLAT